ncbi:hypothetical protein GTGU_04329 [Trabulsiella guamensis ATCC 49490]|uniref:Uncharacterized protein n=1 Tax=Trabulsiella guamensis ATCC 49490 TaxID=1005994 RepID=A0A084ZPD2_9ENTR|nr:hypothetical protein GTGU_04329 [Trabulsiella guamensis ATCC 49490]
MYISFMCGKYFCWFNGEISCFIVMHMMSFDDVMLLANISVITKL